MRTDYFRIKKFVDTLCPYPYIKAEILPVGLRYILYSLPLFVKNHPIITGITSMPIIRTITVNDYFTI